MFSNGSLRDPIFINTVGHCAGALLFGVVIALLIRDGRANGMRRIRLSLIAAGLAFAWNLSSLLVIGSGRSDSLFIAMLSTASFSVLSVLPAVLLQVALQGKHNWLLAGGYFISFFAACLHFSEALSENIRVHQLALLMIAVGFAVLTTAAIYLRARQTSDFWTRPSEWISLGCLLLFTTSFLHFGYEHANSPWSAEIGWHHLGIPVALILLLQDYRFLLLDTFIRFLVNSCLAGLYIAGVVVINQHFYLFDAMRSSAFLAGTMIVALCCSLILFAYFRNAVQARVSRVVFRRQNLEDCISIMSQMGSLAVSEDQLLETCSQQVARHLQAESWLILGEEASQSRSTKPSVVFRDEHSTQFERGKLNPEARIPLRFSSGDTRFLVLGPRPGGRRYLSEDLEDMRRLATVVIEQVERYRADELRRLVNEAELRALQAQINPHFLFNALNTLYGTIDRHSRSARQLVLNLADIFRYVLQDDRSLIPLGEELRIVQAYLEIEKMRLGDRLHIHIDVALELHDCLIPVLSLQPLVENAVKHGIVPKRTVGSVSISASRLENAVRVSVSDTGNGFHSTADKLDQGAGLGLQNVGKRLALYYGRESGLNIQSTAEGAVVSFDIPYSATAARDTTDGQPVASARGRFSPA